MTDQTRGIFAMILACTVWGLSPLFYAQLRHVPAFEVLSYRTLWSLAFFALVLLAQGRIAALPRALGQGRAIIIAAAALMIGINWFGFIYSIQVGRTVEASLGYYIFPLVAVLLGRTFFRETLSTAQWIAVALAALAVLQLTIGLGAAPWISLLLAFTFGTYGVLKKQLDLGPLLSVTAEVLVLVPIALVYAIAAGPATCPPGTHLLLIASGPLTATPLILFSYAARRVRLATIGLLQYLNPTLQFLCATLVFREAFTRWHLIAFALIWTALAVYSGAAFRRPAPDPAPPPSPPHPAPR